MRYLFIVFISMSILFVNTLHADEVVTIFGNEYKPPKIWITKDGVYKGILIEVMKEVEKDLNVKFNFQTYPWARSYKMAMNSRGGITGISFTHKREKIFDFNKVPLFYDTMVLVTKKGKEFKFDNIKDLKGKKIGYCRGCNFGEIFEKAKEYFIPVETDDSREQRLALVLNGKIDAAILGPGKYGLKKICKENKLIRYEQFSILEKPLTVDPNYIAFSKELNKRELLKEFDEILHKKIESGVIEEITNKVMSDIFK